MSIITFTILIIIGLLAGLISGIVGIGGGLVIIPLLVVLLGFNQHEAQGTSLALMLPPIGILAVINYYNKGFVNWHYAFIIAFAFIIGGYFGSRFAINIRPEILSKVFGVFMLVVAIKMILK